MILYYLLIISYFLGAWQIFAISSYGFKSSDLIIILLIFKFLKEAFIDGKKYSIPKSNVFLFLSIFLLLIPFSIISPILSGSNEEILQFFKTSSHFYFLAFLGIYFFIDPPEEKTLFRMFQLFLICGLIINVFGVYQMFARAFNLPLAWIQFTNIGYASRGMYESIESFSQISLRYSNFFRATSIFPEPSSLAGFNVIVILLLIIPFISKSGMFFKNKTFVIINIVFSLVATFLTFSLSGVLGIFLIFVGLLIFNFQKVKKYIIPFFIISTVVIFVVDSIVYAQLGVSIIDLFANRISGIIGTNGLSAGMEGESFFSRLKAEQAAYTLWTQKPIFGIGFGCTSFHGIQFNNTQHLGYKLLFPDTTFVGVLAETGIFTAIAFLTFTAILFYKGYKYYKNILISKASFEMKVLSSIVFFWMLQFFEVNYITGYPLVSDWFWIPVALLLAIEHRMLKSEKTEEYRFQFVRFSLKEYLKSGFKNEIRKS